MPPPDASSLLWTFWTNSPKEPTNRAMLATVADALGAPPSDVTFAPYPKTGGFRVAFRTPMAATTWAECVLLAIQSGLLVGYGWSLTGDAEHELSGWSNEPRVPGLVSISWDLVREP